MSTDEIQITASSPTDVSQMEKETTQRTTKYQIFLLQKIMENGFLPVWKFWNLKADNYLKKNGRLKHNPTKLTLSKTNLMQIQILTK